ncbi:MAG: type II toxin-antitoxin system VapC family toxin [Bacteroidetes bacterium]|nr:MAG: type II toxin-antitoxin system VapC family toxin [Bacteroidota bacterium]
MKKYLLDTHIFLNAYIKPEKISRKVIKILESDSEKFISAISLIEIPLLMESKPKEFKPTKGINEYIKNGLKDLNVKVLDITTEHSENFYNINLVDGHKDQFDRMIIAQGMSKNVVVISNDKYFPEYKLELISD